jgi:predicted dithiol-disulfide oxidoreductase (DUF899 family)
MHRTATREEWRAERRELLAREKELTRLSDELAAARRELPWVPIEKEYVFDAIDGPKTLVDLFDGRSQLIVQHLMFGPGQEKACRGCSGVADHLEASWPHLHGHDVSVAAISRAPVEQLEAYREPTGWTFPWVSSGRSDFNFDFDVSSSAERPLREHNFAPMPEGYEGDLPGMSAFVLVDGVVHHAYSTYARGMDVLWGTYQWLDRAPLGRNEDGVDWIRRRYEYAEAAAA